MLSKMMRWYRDLEAEQNRVLKNPDEVLGQPPGLRRSINTKLAQMSAIERMQMLKFSERYRGWRFFAALAGWIAVFTLIGLILYLVKPEKGLAVPVAIANLIGIAVLCMLTTVWFNYRKFAEHWFRFFAVFIVCSAVGGFIGFTQAAFEKGQTFSFVLDTKLLKFGLIMLGVTMIIAVPMSIIGLLRNRQYQMLTAQLEMDADRQRMERELSEARLRMLSAQIEPHFLFNTLGAVQQLAEQGAPRAAELTASLIAFLRASLSEMRSEKVRLRSDFDLVAAYLQVMQVRLGERLSYSLDLPDDLADCTVPSMMLLTLVENAIKHGIEPSVRGGHIKVAACLEHGALKLVVRDSGSGMSVTPGAGEGLDNIKKRLQLTYGPAATLSLQDADDGGLLAEILIYIVSQDHMKAVP